MSHVHVTDPVDEGVLSRLRRSHEVTLGYGPEARTWEQVADTVEAALVRAETITGERIAAAPRLRIVARHGVGTDNVDLEAAARAGVWVTTTPGANARAVAEHVFALLLTLMRRTREASAHVRDGHWSEGKTALTGLELHGKRMLLIGGGGIARLVIPIAHGFGMRVLVADPYLDAAVADELGVTLTDLDAGLPLADVVSIHVPFTDATRHLLDARRLALLPERAVVINTSRGGIVDEAALIERVRAGDLAGAGLDVIESERVDTSDPLRHNTHDLSIAGVIVTPHVAGQTAESLTAVGMLAVESIEDVLAGRRPARAVQEPAGSAVV
ncbi:NAD(P)-dependent oxidoreductase [Microbacterium sp. cf332]|uniref:NAD(P)-dependent oxidoreductase n=1 Tax=Microbacterium sp. cf332 TaxID=1761804 RepID=UPI00088A1127|nr:NAD(P)-dependent oxidoreductase [Microbacterium sp. cf332]SDQ64894.1 D-3-phosphoglycerate dehydrogenase [Microbacterium sp. cf332]